MFFRRSHSDDASTRRLTQPLAIEDGRPPRILTTVLYTLSGFVAAAIAWAAVTQIQEVTNAPGQIIPSGQLHAVQHLEGGIVAEILIHEGARVVAGQPLIRLDPASTASDRNQLESRRAGLKLQFIRLEAESRDQVPDFGRLSHEYPNLALEQVKLYGSSTLQRRNERVTLQARVTQRRSDAVVARASLDTARLQHAVQQEQFAIQQELVKQGYTARKSYLDAKITLQRAQGEVANLEGKLATAEGAIAEAESSLAEAEATAARKIAEDRTKATADLGETEQQIAKFADRVERLLVRAPSDGLVQELVPKTTGEVIRPGDLVARIVPSGYALVAEIRIDPKDAGHIAVGARADIKFATYDSALYGTVPGTVEYLSATTFNPSPGSPGPSSAEPYYKAIVRLSKSDVGTGALARSIAPGMVLQAQIVTGSKSVVRYMLKPVFRSLDAAFTER